MEVEWTKPALQQIKDIASYIALDDPQTAYNWAESVIEKSYVIGRFPELGRKVLEGDDRNTREHFVGNYRLVYFIKPTKIYIMQITSVKQLR